MTSPTDRLLEVSIKKHLANPTHEMHIAFSKLPAPHKWMLFSLLEMGGAFLFGTKTDDLKLRYDELCPESYQKPFAKVLLELTEGFLEKRVGMLRYEEIDWIHPSCRDLTIDELSNNALWRRQFLTRCSLPGILLALSIGGGAEGERNMPLLKTERDWSVLEKRSLELQNQGKDVLDRIWPSFKQLSTAKTSDPAKLSQTRFKALLARLWPIYYEQNKAGSGASTLRHFFEIREALSPSSPFPGLAGCWSEIIEKIESCLDDEEIDDATDAIEEFTLAVRLIRRHEGLFLEKSDSNTACCMRVIKSLCELKHTETWSDVSTDGFSAKELEERQSEFRNLFDAIWAVSQLPSLNSNDIEQLKDAALHFDSAADALDDPIAEAKAEEKGENKSVKELPLITDENRHISIEDVFKDL